MQKLLSSMVAASVLLAATPASAAMFYENRVSRRDVVRHARQNEMTWMNKCDDVTGTERATCLNEALQNASKRSNSVTRTKTDDGMMMEQSMTNPVMTRTMTRTRTKTDDGMMMEQSMTRTGVMVNRISKRFVKRTFTDKRKELVKKCSDLTGSEKAACLNPKLAKMTPKKEDKKMEASTMWYMLDENAMLWWSTDGKEWSESETGTWMDKDGNWLKVMEGKLVWSADQGVTWTEVPEWTWMAGDGVWYKFDADWMLWWSKDNGATWSEVLSKSWPGM